MKKIIYSLLFVITITICGYLFLANIFHVIYLNQFEKFNFSSEQMKPVKEGLVKLQETVDKINKLDTSVYTETELNQIKERFNEVLNKLNNNKIFKYKETEKIYFKDLFVLDMEYTSGSMNMLTISKIIKEYDSNIEYYDKLLAANFISFAYSYDAEAKLVIQSYKYILPDFFNEPLLTPQNYHIATRIYAINESIAICNYTGELVLKVGGYYE